MTTTGLLGLIVMAALALSGCEREERDYRPTPAAAARDQTVPVGVLEAGGGTTPVAFSNEHEESAYAVAEGKRLYRWYNCNGCHANGGGGSGPPLMMTSGSTVARRPTSLPPYCKDGRTGCPRSAARSPITRRCRSRPTSAR